MELKPYPKYKSTGIEWIGEIPEHWEVKRLASFGRFSKGGGISRAELTDSGLPAVLYGDIYTKYNIWIKDVFHKVSEETAKGSKQITRNAILFTGSGETMEDIGKCVVYLGDEIAFAGGDVIVFEQFENDSLFLSYALNTEGAKFEKAGFSKGEIIVHISSSKLKEIKIPIPPLKEQIELEKFLTHKTFLIDKLISDKQKLIELLKEEKAALVNQAVTKGINPKAKMKDSDIQWLGEIPEHWVVKRLKHELQFFDNKRIPLSSEERGKIIEKKYDYYGASGVIDKVDNFLFDGDYILIGEDGANLLTRSTALAFKASGKFWVNNHAHILKPYSGDLIFFVYLLENIDYTIYVTGSAQPKLTSDNLASIEIPVPPINEQKVITIFITENSEKIDIAISKTENEITLLQEYRTALISEVVTGKMDVRN